MKRGLLTIAFLLLAIFGLSTLPAAAQGGYYRDISFTWNGVELIPNAGARVSVCAATATNVPCTPTVSIYADAALSVPLANPLITGYDGSWAFYAAPGQYKYTVNGAGLFPQGPFLITVVNAGGSSGGGLVFQSAGIGIGTGTTFNCSVNTSCTNAGGVVSITSSGGGGGGSPGGVGGDVQTNNGLSGFAGGTQLSLLSQKPTVSDAACYVTANGNDANDGLSLGTAKLTVNGCLLSLPGGSSTTFTAGKGTIYLQSGSTVIQAGGAANSVLILGSGDPHGANTLSSCSRSGNVVTLTFGSNHNYLIPWSSGTTYAIGVAISYMGQNYISLVAGNLNNTPSSTLGVDWQVFGAPGGQLVTVYGTTGGATSFNGNFATTGGTASTLTYSQTGPNESCSAATGSVLPEGFLHESGSVNFVAAGAITVSNSPGSIGAVAVAGNAFPMPVPFATFQQSGTGFHYYSEGITWFGCNAIALGLDSNFLQSSGASSFSPTFKGGSAQISFTTQLGCGPAIYIGRNALFNNFSDFTVSGLGERWQTVTSVTRSSNLTTVLLSSPMQTNSFQVGDLVDLFGQGISNYDLSDKSFNSPHGGFTVTSVPDSTHVVVKNLGADCASACLTGTIELALNYQNNRRAAIQFNPVGGNSDLHVKRMTLNTGGIVSTSTVGSSSFLDLESLQGEGSAPTSQPLLDCKATPCPTIIGFDNLGISDQGDISFTPGFKIAAGNSVGSSDIDCVAAPPGGITIEGPSFSSHCIMGFNVGSEVPNVSPAGKAQQGLYIGPNRAKAWVELDDLRRAGSPSNVRFSNLAASAPGSWTNVTGGALTITTGITDTLGGTAAANLSVSSSNGEADSYSASRTVKAGDYFFAGVWAQSASTSLFNAGFFHNCPVQINFSNSNTKTRGLGFQNATNQSLIDGCPYQQDDGSWQWIEAWDSVTGPDATETVKLKHFVNTASPENLFAPILIHVPLATLDAQCTATCIAAVSTVASGGGYANWTTSSTNFFKVNQRVCIQGVADTSYDGCVKIISIASGTVFQTTYAGASTSSSGGTAYATQDSEAAEIAQGLTSYLNTCAAQTTCDLVGQVPHVNTAQTWTATQTYSNPVVFNSTTTFGGVPTFNTNLNLTEQAAPSGASSTDVFWGDSTAHWPKFNPNNAGAVTVAGITGAITPGHCAQFTSATTIVDNGGACGSGGTGTVTSFSSGNLSPLFTTSVATAGTTPALSFALSTAGAHTFYMNNTGGTATPGFQTAGEADLPAATVFTDQNATFGAHTYSFATATILKPPAAAGFASTANDFGLNTTTSNWQFWANGANKIAGMWSAAPTNGHCVTATVSAGNVLLSDSGTVGCGGTPPTIQTDTVNNTSQSVLNFTDTAGASGIQFTNPSGGIESAVLASVTGGGNAVAQMTAVGPQQGDYVGYNGSTNLVNLRPGVLINAQVGTSYTIAADPGGDRGKQISMTNASAMAVTLPQAGSSGYGSSFYFCLTAAGGGAVTITPTTSTINGAATLVLMTGESACVTSDNTNYFARVSGFASGTTGTITGTALTATCDSGTVTINGAVAGTPVRVSSTTGADVGGAFNLRASVTSSNTITVFVCGTGTPSSLTYNVRLE